MDLLNKIEEKYKNQYQLILRLSNMELKKI